MSDWSRPITRHVSLIIFAGGRRSIMKRFHWFFWLGTGFAIPPRQPVHFLMTTGNITQGQAALYVAETTTGKFGVYSMGPRADNQPGVSIRRHDMVMFRPGGK